MIDPKELRIGNRINYTGNHLFNGVFDEQFARYMFDVNDEWEFLEPIPLTEEWLLRFGYEKERNPNNPDKSFYWNDGEVLLIQSDKLYCSDITSDIEIKHVHQLQNLYFALTGQELTIKTPVEV